jgi:hypothetical protein
MLKADRKINAGTGGSPMKKLSSARLSVRAFFATFVRGWSTAAELRTEAQRWFRPL